MAGRKALVSLYQAQPARLALEVVVGNVLPNPARDAALPDSRGGLLRSLLGGVLPSLLGLGSLPCNLLLCVHGSTPSSDNLNQARLSRHRDLASACPMTIHAKRP